MRARLALAAGALAIAAAVGSAAWRLPGVFRASDAAVAQVHGLTRSERTLLPARSFDLATDVYVAAPLGFAPFWLEDLGFHDLGLTFRDPEVVWTLWRRRFAPGWVGLGVASLDWASGAAGFYVTKYSPFWTGFTIVATLALVAWVLAASVVMLRRPEVGRAAAWEPVFAH